MTNERLAELIQEDGNDELLPLLWEKTRLLIYKKCGQLWKSYSGKLALYGYSFDDLFQESYNALIFAVKWFKSEKGYKFNSYLDYALKHVIRGLMSGSDILNRPETRSLEQPLGENDDGEPLLIGDTVADERATAAYEEIERLDEFAPLCEAVYSLPDIERSVIIEYYFKGLTYKQIGKLHSFSAERARQLLDRALWALRHGESSAKLRLLYGAGYEVREKGAATRNSPI